MATGAHNTYDEPIGTGGNREDLSDLIYNLSPTETPFISAIKKGEATATNHEWLTDALAAAADNAHIEGEDAAATDPASRVRLGNYTQIFKKFAVVTGTQEKVLKGGGVKSEMAYQVSNRMKEIKRDVERACVGVSKAKVAGNTTTARVMGSLDAYLNSTSFMDNGSGATAPTGNGVDAPSLSVSTPAALTESGFTAAAAVLWNQSGGNENILALVGKKNRGIISSFSASSAKRIELDESKKFVASIKVYDGDFHTITVMPDRFSIATSVFLIDPEYLKLCDLRPLSSKDLATLGDSARKELVWETTLEVCNPLACINLADTTS